MRARFTSAAGLLCALALSVALTSPAWAGAPFRWDVPGAVQVTDVVGEVQVDGVPIRMQVVVTKEPFDALVQHFAQKFADAGFCMAPVQKSPVRQPTLTAFDPASRTTYTVVFDAGPGKHVTVVLGTARWSRQASARRPDFAPVFPGSEGVVRSEDEGARVLSFQAKASPEEIHAWYSHALPSAGFEKTANGFRRGDAEVSLSVRSLGDGRAHVMLLQRPALEVAPGRTP